MTRYFIRLISLITLWLYSAIAFAADPFTVTNIAVDATGTTAIEAQELALKDGQSQAAAIMLSRVTVPSETLARGVPKPTSEMIGRMIRALEISNEQRTAQRYFGDVTIAFNPTEVQRFLQANKLTLFSSQSADRLVVPFSSGDPQDLITALNSGGYENALTPLIVAQDAGGFDPSIARGNIDAAASLASSYGVRQVLAMSASPTSFGVGIDLVDRQWNSLSLRLWSAYKRTGKPHLYPSRPARKTCLSRLCLIHKLIGSACKT